MLKPESTSTPCRIVCNASANYKGHVLNDYWAKGPDMMNNMIGILLRFREETYALVCEISKMYHAIKISDIDQHTHRFLWRFLDISREPDIFVMTSVSFGDRPAGNISITALKNTAEVHLQEFPEAAIMILEDCYVDDVVHSTDDDVQPLIHESNELTTAPFQVKHWQINHPSQPSLKDTKVLGIWWNPSSDSLYMKCKINFSPKVKKQRISPDLKSEDLPASVPPELTQRMILSQINGIFDPLGLLSPITVKAKILMRNMLTNSNDLSSWDTPVSELNRKSG